MKLTAEQYADATARGFKPYWHKMADNFAEACYNMNTYADIRGCKTDPVDKTDCETWEIDEDEWREAQTQVIELAMAEFDEEHAE